MKNILVQPDALIDYFNDKREELKDAQILVAEDTDENTSIYITLDDRFSYYPRLIIEIGDEVDDAQTFYKDDAFLLAYEDAIATYLTDEEYDDEYVMAPSDAERVKVVDSRFNAYLTELLQCAPEDESLTDEDFADLQDVIFRKLFEDFGIEVVYPTAMYTPQGDIIVVQHPYSELELEEEDVE